MAFKNFKIFETREGDVDEVDYDEYYTTNQETGKKGASTSNGNKMILVEPRAYSESQQIADHLTSKNSVVVNFKRVTSDQSKRIIDFLSGTLYAIGGDLQKIGDGIYLCTPKNVDVQGQITEEKTSDNGDEW